MALPKKPCKHCGSDKHWPFQCFYRPVGNKPCRFCGDLQHLSWQCAKNPNRAEQMKKKLRNGKAAFKWLSIRRAWFKANNAGSYHCYICGMFMPKSETTLDHVRPRGSHANLRYELANLEPACSLCQLGKGSRSLTNYLAERDRLGLPVSEYARQRAEKIT